ncbi:MAG: [FeFe] hydrogenase H-cluster radical SAM maturase HydE [bacterium]
MWRKRLENLEHHPEAATVRDLSALLGLDDVECMEGLFNAAYRVKEKNVGKVVYLRGLLEVSNRCECDCHYCGLRRGNKLVNRYCMTEDEIISASLWAWRKGYGSVVLQAGERRDNLFADFIERAVREIKKRSGNELGVTLSLGEQDRECYGRWFNAGAHRYLIRIESSEESLYNAIHPAGADFRARKHCLKMLRDIGYQVGTGVMIGLPGQTVESLAHDILFFKTLDVDMLGMGPYIPHGGTPLVAKAGDRDPEARFNMTLRMMALCRILMPNINIASTTALQALDPQGREKGLMAGANVIMPNITPSKYRSDYAIYPGKPCVSDTPEECSECLRGRILAMGETIGFNKWGDSPHAVKRKGEEVANG